MPRVGDPVNGARLSDCCLPSRSGGLVTENLETAQFAQLRQCDRPRRRLPLRDRDPEAPASFWGLTGRYVRVTMGQMEVRGAARPYNQVARARSQQRTRDALLDAADREFFAGCWEQASLEAIAASARVTKQTLLRHFGSKEGLLEQAALRGYDRVRDERWAAPRGDVAGAVENLLDHYETTGERALRIGALDRGGEVLAEIGRRARQLHYDWVEHAFGSWLARFRGKGRARRRAALIALCDVHTWWLLSHELGLARVEVRATLIQAIESLIKEQR